MSASEATIKRVARALRLMRENVALFTDKVDASVIANGYNNDASPNMLTRCEAWAWAERAIGERIGPL